ncbi:hypothetical protein [Arthrobacter sp. MA-N2]|uniref:hypothetical protein n=1 Tax=Arthrobacter sp. MA-N2 TaxID=1101188 RepID=UPI0004888638|nr:hypothetical protein [Arthrobacter sp. MA-N2]
MTATTTSPATPSQDDGADRPPVSLWRGRVGLIVGIVLLGITLRYAITGMSPLLTTLRTEMGIGVAGASFLGMLPTLSFGIAGFLAPVLIRRWSPELTAALASATCSAPSAPCWAVHSSRRRAAGLRR